MLENPYDTRADFSFLRIRIILIGYGDYKRREICLDESRPYEDAALPLDRVARDTRAPISYAD